MLDATWTHLAYVYDGAEARVYENGVLVNTEAMSNLAIYAVDNLGRPLPFRVGAQNGAGGGIDGQIGSMTIGRVRAYDQALTTEQVQAIYEAERDLFTDPVTGVEIDSATFNEETRQMTITWSAGAPVDVEATEDFENWETVATGVTTGQYTETVPASGHRFYRLSTGN